MTNQTQQTQVSPANTHAITGSVEPLTIEDEVTITDAFVDFNVRYSNPGELIVMTDERVTGDLAYPVEESEPEDTMIAETDEGIFFGWQNTPAHPPANERPVTQTDTVEHEEHGEIERVPMFDHVVKNRQNEREENSVLSVTYRAEYPTSIPTRVEFAQKILNRYVNGPLGTSTTSYWAQKKGRHALGQEYDPYIECEVVMVPRSIFTWEVKAVDDITEDETPFKL